MILPCKQPRKLLMKYFAFLFMLSLKIQCVLYTYNTSQFTGAMNNHMCLVAIVLRWDSSILFMMDRQTKDTMGVLGPPKF